MQTLRAIAALLVLSLSFAAPARAITLLRDPDIEHAMRELAAPVLRAAGLSPERVDILIIDAPSLNAFVVDADSIFLHSGLIQRMETPAMLQSVIAHEAAHIANGHLMRRPIHMRNARTAAALGTHGHDPEQRDQGGRRLPTRDHTRELRRRSAGRLRHRPA